MAVASNLPVPFTENFTLRLSVGTIFPDLSATWPCVRIVGGRFTKIVEACPDKLTNHPRMVVITGKVEIGDVGPRAAFVVVTVGLVTGMQFHLMFSKLHWEKILAA